MQIQTWLPIPGEANLQQGNTTCQASLTKIIEMKAFWNEITSSETISTCLTTNT